MGTKHWTTGRVRSSRYPGRVVNTYNNVPGQVFQAGSGYEYNEPTIADIPDSPDCGYCYVRLKVNETAPNTPYADANLQLKADGVVIVRMSGTDDQTYPIPAGKTITIECFSELPTTGSNPQRIYTLKKNTITQPQSGTLPADPGNSSPVFNDVSAVNDQYFAECTSTADAPSAPIACGASTSYSGGASFPTRTIHSIGSSVGTSVVIDFDALGIPDKFIGYIAGNKVFDTGYRGDSSNQAALNAALAARGLPPEPIVAVGAGSVFFTKTLPDQYLVVEVYAPLSGTAWSYKVNCPV